MQAKTKISTLLLFIAALLLLGRCGATHRFARTEDADSGSVPALPFSILMENNIAGEGLFIRKFKAEIMGPDIKESFSGNVRIDLNGVWLISIRIIGGIEIFRIMADQKEIVILDRMAREARLIEWKDLERNYGISHELLPLIIGDLPAFFGDFERDFNCSGANYFSYRQMLLAMQTDCSIGKISAIAVEDSRFNTNLRIDYLGFLKQEDKYMPADINVVESSGGFEMKVLFGDISSPWKDLNNFAIPGNYRRVK